MPNDVIDDTVKDVTSKTGADASVDAKSGAEGGDKGTAADAKPQTGSGSGKTQEQIESLLEKYNLSSAEELDEFIGNLSTLKNQLGSENIEDLLQNKKQLQKIQNDWQRAEEAKRRESETPEQTIERLEGEIGKLQGAEQARQQAARAAEEDRKLITNFNSFVSKSVDGLKDLSKTEAKFVKKYLGVNNPIHDIELTDREGIAKLVTTAAKDFQGLKDAIIEDYEKNGKRTTTPDTKTKVPPMTRGAEPGSNLGEKQPKNLRESRDIAKKQLTDLLLRR